MVRRAQDLIEEALPEPELLDLFDQGKTDFDEETRYIHPTTMLLLGGLKRILARARELKLENRFKNDEIVWMRAMAASFATVIEIQSMQPDGQLRCLDLLAPGKGEVLLMDRTIAREASRFTRILGWFAPFPHYVRPTMSIVPLDEKTWPFWLEGLKRLHRKAKKRAPKLTLSDCLGSHYAELLNLTKILWLEWRRTMLSKIDLHECQAEYAVRDAAQLQAILSTKPEVLPTECDEEGASLSAERRLACYDWVRAGESQELENEMPENFRRASEDMPPGGLAYLTLYKDRVLLKTFSKQKFEFAKNRFQAWLGPLVQFKSERIVDLAKQLLEKNPSDSPTEPEAPIAAPAEVLAAIRQKHRHHYKVFLDASIPALNGLTPRQAAIDPGMRPALIDLMKAHLHGIEDQNRRQNFGLNIDWVLDELGLPELK